MPESTAQIRVEFVDYWRQSQTDAWKSLLNAYALDLMGGGREIPPAILDSLPEKLSTMPTAFSLLAFYENQPAGIANCFFGFSTFAAKRLVNIHDIAVTPAFRGKGVAQSLLASIEQHARTHDCCKLTLEVLSNNQIAKKSYTRFGFNNYELTPAAGTAEFWEKKL